MRPGSSLAPSGPSLWETIAVEAGRESELWAAALRPEPEREEQAVFSPLAEERFAVGLETIYEGYLLHYGKPRLFRADDRDTRDPPGRLPLRARPRPRRLAR